MLKVILADIVPFIIGQELLNEPLGVYLVDRKFHLLALLNVLVVSKQNWSLNAKINAG